MKRLYAFVLAFSLLLPACEKQRVDSLEERVVKLENKIAELEQKLAGPAPGEEGDKRIEALAKLRDLAVKLSEQTYKDEAGLAAGTGAVDVLVIPREEGDEFKKNFLTAMQDIRSKEVRGLAGVEILLGEKSYGKSKEKGPVRISGLTPGSYKINLHKEGLEDREYPFEVREGKVKQIVTFMLKPGDQSAAQDIFDKMLEKRGSAPEAESPPTP
ncbi:MAG: hypothetical protein AB1405_15265 [Bdellovibrionota bacterium]